MPKTVILARFASRHKKQRAFTGSVSYCYNSILLIFCQVSEKDGLPNLQVRPRPMQG